MTLSTYIISWYTQSCLIKTVLATQGLHCCAAFSFICKLKSGDIITTGQYMNYQTLSDRQFRLVFENSFRSFHIDLRDARGEKVKFFVLGITRLVLMFSKAFILQFQRKTRYKMVAPRQVEIPFYRGIGRQRRKRFGWFAQVFGRKAIPFLCNYVVPATNCVSAELMEFAAPENAEVVSGGKSFKNAAMSVRRQTLKKQLGDGSEQKRVVSTKFSKPANQSRRNSSTNVSHQ